MNVFIEIFKPTSDEYDHLANFEQEEFLLCPVNLGKFKSVVCNMYGNALSC